MFAEPERIARLTGSPVREVRPVGGGCVAGATRVDCDRGTFFLKWGRGTVAESLAAEVDGLGTLEAATGGGLQVPHVLGHAGEEGDQPALLVLEWIEAGVWTPGLLETLGSGLAAMHAVCGDRYGHGIDNFIGRLPQENGPAADWPEFYRSRRLEPQVREARLRGTWKTAWDRPFEALCRSLEERLPTHPVASTLHGDLWSGNVLASTDGRAVLVDPAVHAGDREADLAMTRLFDGFGDRLYAAYDEAWPRDPGWEDREPIYQLYHLINHLNHFGDAYAGAIERTLRPFATG